MSLPDQDLVDALEAAGGIVRGTSVTCPFHGDRNASGSIYSGTDGRWRYKCHGCDAAGDAADIIARHTGRPLAEVLSSRHGGAPPPTRKPGRCFATLSALAVSVYGQQPEAMYLYPKTDGRDHLAVLRMRGKRFGQAKWTTDGWQSGGVGAPFPLYRLPALAGDPSAVVVITEGEKDADTLAALGIMTTTAPMGADAINCPPDKDGKPGKVDWSPLAGRAVVLFGDDDDPGRHHMARVARCLGRLNPAPVLSMVRGEDRHGCKDAADLIAAHGAEVARLAIAQAVPCCAPEATPPATPSFDLRSFADTQSATMTWIWEDVIPCGMLSLVAGKQGLGKSYMLCDLAARVSTGSPMPDGKPQQPGNVLMLVREDDASLVLKPRLIAAGADESRITWSTFHNTDTHAPLDLAQHIEELARTVTAYRFSMIIVDTFASFASIGTDANAAQSVRGVLDPLARLARQTGAAVMVVAHVRKAGQGEGDAMDAIAGSAQMTAGVRVAGILDVGQAQGERWFHVVKSNLGQCDGPGWTWRFQQPAQTLGKVSYGAVPRIVWTVAGESYRNADADRRAGRVTVDPAETHNAVLAAVAKRPLTVKEATELAWKGLQRRFPGIRKADVAMDVEDLAADPGSSLGVGKGPKGARLIGLPGAIPELPEDKARRLAEHGMTVGALAKLAGCRRAVATDILRDLRP